MDAELSKCSKSIAIIGGGPGGVFMLQSLSDEDVPPGTRITVFERSTVCGPGMPYSAHGSGPEHITNVSGNEIPALPTTLTAWLNKRSDDYLSSYAIDRGKISEYRVVPRLLFGEYLAAQFEEVVAHAASRGIQVTVRTAISVVDIKDNPVAQRVGVVTKEAGELQFDIAIIAIGHHWPTTHEKNVEGYFDSPYPPQKIETVTDRAVAIRGSSLTAIDAVRTLAKANGKFSSVAAGGLRYEVGEGSKNFRIVMYSRSGLLPCVRFHLEDSRFMGGVSLSSAQISDHRSENDGFVSLDFIYRQVFIESLRDADPKLYDRVKGMTIEQFICGMLAYRAGQDPFDLMVQEYNEAKASIRNRESIPWKEMLGKLSYAMNYPAKYFSAEDMLRLRRVLMPLISVVIAYAPQSSCEELLALHADGRLQLVAVGEDCSVSPLCDGKITVSYTGEIGVHHEEHYSAFIDCIGQPHIDFADFPFASLVEHGRVSRARLQIRGTIEGEVPDSPEVMTDGEGTRWLSVSGVAMSDDFQLIDIEGVENDRLYIMAVPYIGGYNPDYSGLDFCETASAKIAKRIFGSSQLEGTLLGPRS